MSDELSEDITDRDFTVDGSLLWDVIITLLTFDEFLRNRGRQIAREDRSMTGALLHIAQNRIITTNTIEKLYKVLNSKVTPEEKARLTEYMKGMKKDEDQPVD